MGVGLSTALRLHRKAPAPPLANTCAHDEEQNKCEAEIDSYDNHDNHPQIRQLLHSPACGIMTSMATLTTLQL